MVLLQDTFPLSVEMHIISAFVLVVLGAETALALVMHRRRNPESGIPAIRACLVGVRTVVMMNGVDLIIQLFFGANLESRMITYGIFLVVIDIGCITLFARLRPFARARPILFRTVIPLAIGLSLAFLVIHSIELLSANSIAILPGWASICSAAPIIGGPLIFVLFLHAHGDREVKPFYKVIVLAISMLGLGGALHLVPIEDRLAGIGIDLGTTAIFSTAFYIAGIATFLGTVYVMPYIEDLYWRKEVVGVYLLNNKTGHIVFKRDFQVAKDMDPSTVSDSDRDSALMGGLSSIDDLVREMTNDAGGRLEFIDKEGLKFVLSWYKHLLFVVIARINLPVIKAKLAEFKNHFITQFGDVIKDKAASESRQADLAMAVDRVFKGRDAA